MQFAGVALSDADVLKLAGLLGGGFVEVRERLVNAYNLETKVLALTIVERESILRALDAADRCVADLRGVLLAEHVGRESSDRPRRL